MKAMNLKSRTDADGILQIQIPTEMKERSVDVVVVFNAANNGEQDDHLDWPAGFFEETFGVLANDPIERLPQGAYPEREELG